MDLKVFLLMFRIIEYLLFIISIFMFYKSTKEAMKLNNYLQNRINELDKQIKNESKFRESLDKNDMR